MNATAFICAASADWFVDQVIQAVTGWMAK